MNNATQEVQPSASTLRHLWNIDRVHSSIGFSVRHLMVTNVRGVFERFSGTVSYDPRHPEATRFDVSVEAASVYTGEPQRDTHLRSADFFDVEKCPSLTFRSHTARLTGAGSLEVTGELTLRGVTRPQTLLISEISAEQRDLQGARRIGGNARAQLRRSEFGITFNKLLEAGNVAVSDEVTLTIDASLVAAG